MMIRNDAAPETVVAIFDQIRAAIFEQIRRNTQQAAQQTGSLVYRKGKERDANLFKRVLTINLTETEPWLGLLMQSWVTENVSLVRSVGEESLNDLEQTLLRMLRDGESKKNTQQALQDQFNLTKNRARVIARDQVNKLNGQITEERQTRLGINTYTWLTVGDERVRGKPGGRYPQSVPNHWMMEGLLCRWGDKTMYSADNGKTWRKRTGDMPKAHPGEEIQCRCTGEPNLAEVDIAI